MKTVLRASIMAALLTGAVAAQGSQGTAPAPIPAPAAPAPQAAPAAPVPPRTNTNIRVDVTVVDEGGAQPLRKTVSLTTVDGFRGSSRSIGGFGPDEVNLNVDATPNLEPNGKIRARIVLVYKPGPPAAGPPGGGSARLTLDFPIVLDDGKMLVASRTTDPSSDRRVTVEVTATILK